MIDHPEIVALETERQRHAARASHQRIHDEMPSPFWDDMLREHPVWAAAGAHRAIFDGDRAVALTSVGMWPLRLGAMTLPAAEIGLVGTLPDYRNRGMSRALLEDAIVSMRERQVPLMFLIGIPGFYERWGFHYACPDHVNAFLSVTHDALAACAATDVAVRPLDRNRDTAPVLAMIAEEHRHTPCSPVLDGDILRYLVDRSDAHGVAWMVVENAGGARCAVVRWKRWGEGVGPQAQGAVTLVATRSDADRSLVAKALLDHLHAPGVAELPLAIAPHSPFAEWLYLRGARRRSASSVYPGGYAAMVRVSDLAVVLKALRTGWDEAGLIDRHAGVAVTLRAGREDPQVATIRVRHDGVAVAEGDGGIEVSAPPAVTVPWLTGWRSAGDWLDGVPYPPLPGPAFDPGNPAHLDPAAQALLRDLFPHRHPYIGDTIQGG